MRPLIKYLAHSNLGDRTVNGSTYFYDSGGSLRWGKYVRQEHQDQQTYYVFEVGKEVHHVSDTQLFYPNQQKWKNEWDKEKLKTMKDDHHSQK